MAATPVDDHAEEFEQLAGLSALGALDGDELARFEAHAAVCERCRVTVQLDREALNGLALTAPVMDPSPDFKARLMQRAAQELAEREPPPNVIPIWRRRSPWLNAVAAVLVLAVATFAAYSYQNAPIATVQITGSGPGSATVVVRRSGAAELQMQGIPDPGQGFIYEAWIIKDDKPIPAGTATSGNAHIPLEADPRGATVAVTREPTRVSAPTTTPFLAGEVRL